MRRWRRWLLEAGVALLALYALQEWLTREVVRGPLPTLQGELLDGRPLEHWRAALDGRSHVVYVWATWCGVCKAMQANVDAASRDRAVLSVAFRSGEDTQVRRQLASRGLDWATLNDPEGAIGGRLGVSAVPLLLFVDGQGVVRAVSRGYTTEAGIRARLWWIDRAG